MPADPNNFSTVFVVRGFAAFEGEVTQTIATLEAMGHPERAKVVKSAYRRYVMRLEDISEEVAAVARTEIVEAERASRIRDDTMGEGGARLEDHIGFSEPYYVVPGTVLVNDEQELEDNGVEWWWTQEWGYSGHVGREIHGFFHDPGFARASWPNPTQSGDHPLFTATGENTGGTGTIERPLTARGFTQEGAHHAEAEWHALIHQARRDFMGELARAAALP